MPGTKGDSVRLVRARCISTRVSGLLALALCGLLGAAPVAAVDTDGIAVLRVGTSGDYAPFSAAGPDGSFEGFDVALVREYAAARGLQIEWVRFRWPELAADLGAGRFDLAASGVTMRADRALIGVFTVPVAETGAMVLVRPGVALDEADLGRPGLAMAVNAGGHLERVARLLFPAAALRAIPDNGAVIAALMASEVDAVVTDSAEAVHWQAQALTPPPFGPFTRDRKAWLIGPGRDDLASDINGWLIDLEADGELARRRVAAGVGGEGRPALAINALVTAIAERLALMPAVAEAKRLTDAPVHVPERERIVIASAVEAARASALRARLPVASDEALADFFAELIAAARAVQEAVLVGPAADAEADPASVPDLDRELRPALLRIGARIGTLLPRLPSAIAEGAVEAEFARSLDLPGIDAERRKRLAAAITSLAAAPRAVPKRTAGEAKTAAAVAN